MEICFCPFQLIPDISRKLGRKGRALAIHPLTAFLPGSSRLTVLAKVAVPPSKHRNAVEVLAIRNLEAPSSSSKFLHA
ncbi:hypothetical protein NC653_023774 [Populus alba x Populus x berolinensis]|uniref:Uncharacterized protein n=1 Tax=Populus alba x Populus x berolinensis TaxID=444605 RepID=A0AAD6MI32_9ROSI|nr:hypothetical protein NC653_023774 [Populus alba x Populus x berolinensis]